MKTVKIYTRWPSAKVKGDNPLKDKMPEITSDVERNISKETTKEINKLLYFTEQTDELIESGDEGALKQVELRCNKINDRLSELISEMEEFKIDKGETSRAVERN